VLLPPAVDERLVEVVDVLVPSSWFSSEHWGVEDDWVLVCERLVCEVAVEEHVVVWDCSWFWSPSEGWGPLRPWPEGWDRTPVTSALVEYAKAVPLPSRKSTTKTEAIRAAPFELNLFNTHSLVRDWI